MPGLRLYLLGPPRLERDGQALVFKSRKNLALAAYLAVTGQSHTRDALIALFWPELEPSRARAGLRRNLSEMKSALDDEWLVVDRETVASDPEAGLWLDVAQFRHLAEAWRRHSHPETEVCPACLAELAEAVELYTDDFLAGFSLRDSAAFDEWQFFEAEELKRTLASSLERLVTGYSAQGQHESAISYARRRLALDPLHEPAHRSLMALHAGAGRRSAASRQYQECVRVLHDELGVEPSEETNRLRDQILSGSVGTGAGALPRHNLPAQLTPFVGRRAELGEIQARLSDPGCRLLTLVGPGGIGKTRLALQAAEWALETQAARFDHGVVLVRLAPMQSVEAFIPAIAGAIDFRFREGGTPRQQLLDDLRRKRMLLLLDSLEHLMGALEMVTEILRTAPGVTILATSRTRLNVQGEYVLPLAGMDTPPEGAAFDQAGQAAVELFVQSARRSQPLFELTADNWTSVARICRLVDGMPLGILLAAAWTEMLTPGEIAVEISRSLDFLSLESGDLPIRQRSLRAVFDHSWNLLDERARSTMQALSVFRGGFTWEAAREVTGASLRDLKALVDRSLIQGGVGQRYEIHELLRQFAAEILEGSPAAYETAHDRHSGFFMAALQRWEPDIKGSRQMAILESMDEEVENVRAAWNWAASRRQWERLDQAMVSLTLGFYRLGRYQEAETAYGLVVEHLEAVVPVAGVSDWDRLRVLAKALAGQGDFCFTLGRSETAGRLVEKSLGLLADLELLGEDSVPCPMRDLRPEKAYALRVKASLAALDSSAESRQLIEQSLAIWRALGAAWETAGLLFDLAYAVRHLGAYEEARHYLRQSLEIRYALGDQLGISDSLHGLASIEGRLGHPEEGARLARECITIQKEIGDHIGAAHGLGLLGRFHSEQGEYDEAHSVLQDTTRILKDLEAAEELQVWWMLALASAKTHLGRYREALSLGEQVLQSYQQRGASWGVALSLSLLGSAALATGEIVKAQEQLERSVSLARATGTRDYLAVPLNRLGYTARGLGRTHQASVYLCEALRVATEIANHRQTLEALPAIALLLADLGQPERAVELYALASRSPIVGKSCWYGDVAGKPIAVITAGLSPEVVAAAQERGEARELDVTVLELLKELESLAEERHFG